MKLRLITPKVIFVILILKQANEVLNISHNNQNKLSQDISNKVKLKLILSKYFPII